MGKQTPSHENHESPKKTNETTIDLDEPRYRRRENIIKIKKDEAIKPRLGTSWGDGRDAEETGGGLGRREGAGEGERRGQGESDWVYPLEG